MLVLKILIVLKVYVTINTGQCLPGLIGTTFCTFTLIRDLTLYSKWPTLEMCCVDIELCQEHLIVISGIFYGIQMEIDYS